MSQVSPLMVGIVCAKCAKVVPRRKSNLKRVPNRFCSRGCRAAFYFDPVKCHQAQDAQWSATFIDRFWEKVVRGDPNDCWEWQGWRDKKGYGHVSRGGKQVLSHRVALSLTDGDWQSTLLVCHACDNPPCCNPAHLWRGTNQDNVDDRWAKGSGGAPRGEKNGSAKLTAERVIYVRNSQEPTAALARELGVKNTTIFNIKRRLKWKHIP